MPSLLHCILSLIHTSVLLTMDQPTILSSALVHSNGCNVRALETKNFTSLGIGNDTLPSRPPLFCFTINIKDHVNYCEAELDRLDASIAWINSSVDHLSISVSKAPSEIAHVCYTLLTKWVRANSQKALRPLFAVMPLACTKVNGHELSDVLFTVLNSLQPLACRVITSNAERDALLLVLLETEVLAGEAVVGLWHTCESTTVTRRRFYQWLESAHRRLEAVQHSVSSGSLPSRDFVMSQAEAAIASEATPSPTIGATSPAQHASLPNSAGSVEVFHTPLVSSVFDDDLAVGVLQTSLWD